MNRDVKPANILISEEPNGALARIIDLGAAVDIRNGYNYDPKVAKPNRIKPNRTKPSGGGVRRHRPGGGRAPANREVSASVEPALVATGGQLYAGNFTQVGFLDPKYAPPEKYVLPQSVSALSLLASPFLWVPPRANPRTTRTHLSPRPYKLDTNPILPAPTPVQPGRTSLPARTNWTRTPFCPSLLASPLPCVPPRAIH